ncbi:MAG: hypothetical protein ACE5KE_12220 [Methanosarcinales archaeon]
MGKGAIIIPDKKKKMVKDVLNKFKVSYKMWSVWGSEALITWIKFFRSKYCH